MEPNRPSLTVRRMLIIVALCGVAMWIAPFDLDRVGILAALCASVSTGIGIITGRPLVGLLVGLVIALVIGLIPMRPPT
jgi:hypothetical protein